MTDESSKSVATIGIVGGGKIGLQLFELFSASKNTRVEYIVDLNPEAPAIAAARQSNVATFTLLDAALERPVDFVLEVTGNGRVAEAIAQKLDHHKTQVITHQMAYILLSAISESNRRVGVEINGIKQEITGSMASIAGLVESIKDVADQMKILAINARIEAARLGEQGKGFAVVASEISRAAESVNEITRQIDQVNTLIAVASDKIDRSLERLS